MDLPSGEDFASLTALGGLTALDLRCSVHLPTCLPQLLQLQTLRLTHSPLGATGAFPPEERSPVLAELRCTLQQLVAAAARGQQLRHLVLEDVWQLPAEVGLLPQLHTLVVVARAEFGMEPDSHLPSRGPYLSSLRRLALPSWLATASLSALRGMPRLEALALVGAELEGPFVAAESAELGLLAFVALGGFRSLRQMAVSFGLQGKFDWASSKHGQPLTVHAVQLTPWTQLELSSALFEGLLEC